MFFTYFPPSCVSCKRIMWLFGLQFSSLTTSHNDLFPTHLRTFRGFIKIYDIPNYSHVTLVFCIFYLIHYILPYLD